MKPLLLIVAGIAWYIASEILLWRIRRTDNVPSRLSFWLGILQSVGAFALIIGATAVYFLSRNSP